MRFHWLASEAGNALIEFALVAPILALLLLNLFDFSSLIWATMETDYSAQVGAQAAVKACAGGSLPAVSNCAGLTTAVTNAIHGTSLGSAVSLASGYPTETYYCVSGTTLSAPILRHQARSIAQRPGTPLSSQATTSSCA